MNQEATPENGHSSVPLDKIVSWFMRITGGRPMTMDGYAFTDCVSDKAVFYYKDYFGNKWMANDSWGFFRVAAN